MCYSRGAQGSARLGQSMTRMSACSAGASAARPLGKSVPDQLGLVARSIVHDDVNVEICGRWAPSGAGRVCRSAWGAGFASADAILNILARRSQPSPMAPILDLSTGGRKRRAGGAAGGRTLTQRQPRLLPACGECSPRTDCQARVRAERVAFQPQSVTRTGSWKRDGSGLRSEAPHHPADKTKQARRANGDADDCQVIKRLWLFKSCQLDEEDTPPDYPSN